MLGQATFDDDIVAFDVRCIFMCPQGTGDIFYGTDHGTIGLFSLSPDGTQHLRKLWQLPGGGNQVGGVTALKLFDLTSDGVAELFAGREDGTVTVSSLGGPIARASAPLYINCKSSISKYECVSSLEY